MNTFTKILSLGLAITFKGPIFSSAETGRLTAVSNGDHMAQFYRRLKSEGNFVLQFLM